MHWLINRFSYTRIYLLLCLLFFLSLGPIAYFWTTTHLRGVESIDQHIQELAKNQGSRDVYADEMLVAERSYLLFRMWLILSLTFFLFVCACALGLWLISHGTARLAKLTRATEQFTSGRLSTRVDDPYSDDIGCLSSAFNQMAERLQELIGSLSLLQYATDELAKGNLSTRLSVPSQGEFHTTASAFNAMAATFERAIHRLQATSYSLSGTAAEVASAAKAQEADILAQGNALQNIAASSSHIAETSRRFAETMNDVDAFAKETSRLAKEGKEAIGGMESILQEMGSGATTLSDTFVILKEKASNISGLTTAIAKVADQTNLLSLNASIEAEKAGEAGKGFGVIAREIKRLADQTALSTLDVENTVSDILSAVSMSVSGVDNFAKEFHLGATRARGIGDKMAAIIEKVQSVNAKFELVNTGMQGQLSGTEKITSALSDLNEGAKRTGLAIHQFQKTVDALKLAAAELNEIVAQIAGLRTKDNKDLNVP